MEALRGAEQIAVALPALCEFVWVLRRVYAFPVAEISAAIQALMAAGNVRLDRADAVIAHEGQWLGGHTFVSFDRQAVASAFGWMPPCRGWLGRSPPIVCSREIHFSATFVVACELPDWLQGLRQGGQVGELAARAQHHVKPSSNLT